MRSIHLLLAGLMLLCWPSVSQALTLVENGQPTSTIIIARKATKAAQLAAYELQHHIELITGVAVPIFEDDHKVRGTRLLVGDSTQAEALGCSSAGFGSQEYMIKFLPTALVMLGTDKDDREKVSYDPYDAFRFGTWPGLNDQAATLYAVYDVLEKYCGVRWFNPTELGTVCPRRTTLVLTQGRDVRRTPDFLDRSATIYSPEGWESSVGLWRRDAPQFAEVEKMSWPELRLRFPNDWDFVHARRSACWLHLLRSRMGGDSFTCNHSFYGYYDRFWKKNENPKAAERWEGEHPEFFATGYEKQPPQMNYSNEAFIAQVVRDAEEYFATGKKYQGAVASAGKFFGLAPMDNSSWSKDPETQKQLREDLRVPGFNGWASDYIWGFTNRVARELQKTHPDKYLLQLAYGTYTWHPSFPLEPNIAVDMCLHTRNWWAPTTIQMDRGIVEQWAPEAGKRPMHCWLYWTFPKEVADNGKFYAFPGFFAHTAAQQFRWLRESGIQGIFFCGFGQMVEAYVACRMMNDVSLDVDRLLDEFFTMQYGAAGKPLRKFYEAVEKTYMSHQSYPPDMASGEARGGHQTRSLAWAYLGIPRNMATFAAYIAAADAAKVTPLERQRVELFKKQVWEYMLAGRQQFEEQMAAAGPRLEVPRVKRAAGNPKRVPWDEAGALAKWRLMNGQPAQAELSGLIAHDEEYLYLQLTEELDPATLKTGPRLQDDCWQVFTAWAREVPYRQMYIGTGGRHEDRTIGESKAPGAIVGPWDSGAKVISDETQPDRWVVSVALPLSKLLSNGGPKEGQKLYMNFMRTRALDPPVSHAWNPTGASPHEPTKMGEMTLAM